MSAPTPAVRAVTYERDGERCVSCGTRHGLEYQHRQAVGMGGSTRKPLLAEGITSCTTCNPAYEGHLQAAALRFGWKVPRWVETPGMVPVWYPLERTWFLLAKTGSRTALTPARAMELMDEIYGAQYVPGKGLIG